MPKILVERTRCSNTWTEAKFFGFIRSMLRQGWSRYPVKFQAKKAVERTVTGKRHRFEYRCAHCSGWFMGKHTQVDHIIPAGTLRCFEDIGEFCRRLFCELDNLQVLCKPCHTTKTNEERRLRSGAIKRGTSSDS